MWYSLLILYFFVQSNYENSHRTNRSASLPEISLASTQAFVISRAGRYKLRGFVLRYQLWVFFSLKVIFTWSKELKIPLVSSDTGVTVVSLSLSLQSYKDELSTIKNDLDQVRKLGFQIMERVPDEKRTGVERRVEEVVHEHRELEKKVRTKEEVSAHALNTTGL